MDIKIAIKTLIRLNNLRLKKKLNRDTWQEFFLYKNIVKVNANKNELSQDVLNIING